MNRRSLEGALARISQTMAEQKDYLIRLDQQSGDGDLGISMAAGYRAVYEYLRATPEEDLGRLFSGMSGAFNEAAPSSLGTITAIGMMGMAKVLKGKQEATLEELADALLAGIARIMEKAGSKLGEKTILDSLYPAAQALKEHSGEPAHEALQAAAQAAAQGAQSTKGMKSVHGRAAYYGEKTLGMIDGGAVVGQLLFEALYTGTHGA